MAFVRSGNGGGSTETERLCYAQYVGADTVQIPVMDNLSQEGSYSTYLSYSSSTKKFTVLADFDAIIVPWVTNYRGGASRKSQGAFYINNTSVATYEVTDVNLGTCAGKPMLYSFKANDTFWNYTPATNGYPQQMLKVYREVLPTGTLDYEDENA